jgi:hypothetical protein
MPHQLVIYRKAKYGLREFGDLTDVRIGDVVQFWDESQHAFRAVIKVNVKAGVARLSPVMYGDYVLHPSKTVRFDDILMLKRTFDDDYTPNIMDMFHDSSVEEWATEHAEPEEHAPASSAHASSDQAEPAKRKRKVLPKRSIVKRGK